MLFTPLHDRVLVRRIEDDEKTSGGLIIPETPRKSRNAVKLCRSVQVPKMKLAHAFRWTSKRATKSCSENGLALKLRSTAKS